MKKLLPHVRLAAQLLALIAPFGAAACGGSIIAVEGDGGSVSPPPPDGDGASPVACPGSSAIFPGAGCASVGERCTSDNVPVIGCGEPPAPMRGVCTCQESGWACPQIALPCTPPAPPPCPAPANVVPGDGCPNHLGQQCFTSNSKPSGCGVPVKATDVSCTCTSAGWQCPPAATPACPPPPRPTCPDPTLVVANEPCAAEGLTCRGNPQTCMGATYYDALECRSHWIPVATTICGPTGAVDAAVDAGVEDAAGGD